MDGSDAFRHQTEAEQDCHQHEQPVARWVAQQQEELAGAEGSLVDHHINGKYASLCFARFSTGEPTFCDHEDHGRAETENQAEQNPGVRIYRHRQDQADHRQDCSESSKASDMTNTLNYPLAVEATDDKADGMAGQHDADNRRVEPFFRHPLCGQRAEQAVAQQQPAHAYHQGAEGEDFPNHLLSLWVIVGRSHLFRPGPPSGKAIQTSIPEFANPGEKFTGL